MIRYFAFAIAIAAAGPASALSCLQPTVAGTYTNAAESPADYVIGAGSLVLTGPSDPPGGAAPLAGAPQVMVGFTQPAQFAGGLFNGSNFNNQSTVPVTVDVTCTASWCGGASNVDYGLFFFRVVNGAYVLDSGACPGNVFHDTHPGMLEEVIRCHSGSCPGNW